MDKIIKTFQMDKIIKTFQSEIKGIDEKEQTITAFVSTGARDRMGEELDPKGVDFGSFRKNPVVLWAHDYSSPPIAKALWIKRDGDGVVSKMKFANTEFAKEIFTLYKDGFLKAFSVGFKPIKWEDGDGEKQPRRRYTDWELLEYSAVPVPANPEALTLAIQKGVLKQEVIRAAMEKSISDEGIVLCDDVPVIIPPIVEVKKFDELEAEIKLLKEKNEAANKFIDEQAKEITELRFRLYQMLDKKNIPEATVGVDSAQIARALDRVVRKMTGKVD